MALIRRWPLVALLLLASYPLTLAALNLGLGRLLLERAVNAAGRPMLHDPVRIGRVTVDPWLRVQATEIAGALKADRDPLAFSCRSVDLLRWFSPSAGWRGMEGLLLGGRIRSKALQADGLSVALWRPPAQGRGPLGAVQAQRLVLGQLELRDIRSELWGDERQIALRRVQARLYSGQLQGTVTIETAGPQPTFTLEARATGVALSDLAPLNPTMFQGAHGSGTVTARARGAADGTVQFTATCEIGQPGGAVQAPFLKSIMPYIPAAAQTTALRQAVAHDQPIRFQTARLSVESAAPDTLKALLLMALPEYNVVLDVDFTIHVDDAAAVPRLLALWDHLLGDAS